jgi:hypothetical protein
MMNPTYIQIVRPSRNGSIPVIAINSPDSMLTVKIMAATAKTKSYRKKVTRFFAILFNPPFIFIFSKRISSHSRKTRDRFCKKVPGKTKRMFAYNKEQSDPPGREVEDPCCFIRRSMTGLLNWFGRR